MRVTAVKAVLAARGTLDERTPIGQHRFHIWPGNLYVVILASRPMEQQKSRTSCGFLISA
jgi:hypothetical protein